MWAQSRYWRRRQLQPWPDLTESFDTARYPIDAAAGVTGVVTVGQGSQSVAATVTVTLDAVVTTGQGNQSVASVAIVSTDAVVNAGQGSQSVAAVGTVGLNAIVTSGQGGQSVAGVMDVTGTPDPVAPPVTSSGGGIYVLPGDSEPSPRPDHYVPIKREPFEAVKLSKPEPSLKELRDRLFDLGRLLQRNKETVKGRIKAEQAAMALEDKAGAERFLVLQALIAEYELDLHNQNAARILIMLADER